MDTKYYLRKKKHKREFARNWHWIMSEEEKQILKEYGKKYRGNMSEEGKQKEINT